VPASTPRGAFPYPLGDDAPDTDGDLRRLAERIAAAGGLYQQGTAAARPAAAAELAGLVYFATDTGSLSYCTGSAWVGILRTDGKAADSELLDGLDSTAFLAKTAADAKGDLLAATGPDAFSRLAVGPTEYALTADPTKTAGLGWAPGLGAARAGLVVTTEGTTSSGYTDLATIGPTVSTTVGPSGRLLVALTANLRHSAAGGDAVMGFVMTGATSRAAFYADSLVFRSDSAGQLAQMSHVEVIDSLNPGDHTVQAKYRVDTLSGTATFSNRRLLVVPL
jgi:hypothetical protein